MFFIDPFFTDLILHLLKVPMKAAVICLLAEADQLIPYVSFSERGSIM